jgi:hypothetical protein
MITVGLNASVRMPTNVKARAAKQNHQICKCLAAGNKTNMNKQKSLKSINAVIISDVQLEIEYLQYICNIAHTALVNKYVVFDGYQYTVCKSGSIYHDAAYGVYDEDEFKESQLFNCNDVY